MFSPIEDNQVRYTPGSPKGHVESYFLKLNDPASPRALWLKFTILSPERHPKDAVAELWAIAFDGETGQHAAAKQTWAFSDSEAGMKQYPLSLGGCVLAPGNTRGEVEKAGHRIEWDLRFTASTPPMHLFPYEAMYRLPVPRSKTVTPYPDARFEGFYRVDGKEIAVSGWPGTQGHNWGREHAFLYAWSHCNLLYDERGTFMEDSYFEGLSARVRIAGKVTPFLSVAWLRLRGVDFPFTHLRTLARAQAEVEVGARYTWSFSLAGEAGSLTGELEAPRENLVGLYYVNPNGEMTYCLNSKIARLRLSLRPYSGGEIALTSEAAALEIGTRDPHHGVTMVL